MSKYGKALRIASIVVVSITIIGIILMLLAPADTSMLMKLGVFATLYGFMGDIVVWRVYGEFKKANLLKKGESCHE